MLPQAALQTVIVRVLMLVGGVVSSIITARVLGPAGRGQYYLVLMLGGLAVQFGNLGLHASNTYLVAQDRRRFSALLANSFWVSVVVAILAALITVALSASAVSEARLGLSVYWCVLYAPGALFVLLGGNLLLGAGRTGLFNGLQLASALFAVVGVIIVALLHGSVDAFLAALVGAMLATAGITLLCGMRMGSTRLRFDRPTFVAGFHFAAKAFVIGLLSFAVTRANAILMARSAPADQLGFYSVGMQFFDVLSILPISISTVLFPALVGSVDRWRDTVRCSRWTMLLMAPACVAVALIIEPLIVVVFGADFRPASQVTRWLMPAAFCMGVVSVLSQFLAAAGYPGAMFGTWIAGLVVLCGVSSWLIPVYGAIGAAVALSITYLLVLAALSLVARQLAARGLPAVAGA